MSLPEPRPFWAPLAPAVQADWALPEFGMDERVPTVADDGVDEPSPIEEAWQDGWQTGRQEGEAAAETMVRPALDAIARLADGLRGAEGNFLLGLERNLHALAIAIAQKLVQRELTADPMLVQALVRKAIELMPADGPLDVRLHPADLAVLGPHLELYSAAGRLLPIQWIEDPALERGSFLLESPQRLVDGRPDVALRALYEAMAHE